MHENLSIEASLEDYEAMEVSIMDLAKMRMEISGDSTLKVHKDSGFTENPLERSDRLESVKVKSLQGQREIWSSLSDKYPHLRILKIPISEDQCPTEESLDMIVDALKGEPAATQCVFSCQMGRGRTTIGMILACLIKEIQIRTELKKLQELHLVPEETIAKLIAVHFETKTKAKSTHEQDNLLRGKFDVIKELLQKESRAKEAKKSLDRIIDICGPPPKGSGLQNLRECIIETKWKYDVAPEDKQIVWRELILNFMERYFILICFATYALEFGPEGFQRSFKSWMDERSYLRDMIAQGKDKLEWYRQVDPVKLNTLKELISAPNYKENLGTLIQTIYEFAFVTYGDLPRGPIKNNSMRKLAAKTLLEIMPSEIHEEVQRKLDEHMSSPDFITLIGLVSYHGKEGPQGV
eukprot:TCALIF_07887-PA protein Name:"Similar to pald1 Paladin (Danio rerio)" AED:0.24 eAED:0.24 QI:1/0.6/0.33/0.83/1/1/6/0/408